MDTAILSCLPLGHAYTKYHHCSLYSSWEMNLNDKVKIRVDVNTDSITKTCLFKYN